MDEETESSTSTTQSFLQLQNQWLHIQDSLKGKLITQDQFEWRLPSDSCDTKVEENQGLRFVGGVDLSFSKHDSSVACATLVVLELPNLDVVYEDSSILNLDVPYIPGFLAFREAPALFELIEKMKKSANPFFPQLLMVDGNGILHPRGFGLACHLGVLVDIPTVGIGKNLYHVDGLSLEKVKHLLQLEENSYGDILTLIGDSGRTLGAAMRSVKGSLKPIFISVGHRISLCTAIKIMKMTCRYRVPEPTRQADIRSKKHLHKIFGDQMKQMQL